MAAREKLLSTTLHISNPEPMSSVVLASNPRSMLVFGIIVVCYCFLLSLLFKSIFGARYYVKSFTHFI